MSPTINEGMSKNRKRFHYFQNLLNKTENKNQPILLKWLDIYKERIEQEEASTTLFQNQGLAGYETHTSEPSLDLSSQEHA